MRQLFNRSSLVLGAMAVLVAASLAAAQQPGGFGRGGRFRGFGMGGLNNPLMLVNNEVVQKELDLVPDQTSQLQQLPQGMFQEIQAELQKEGIDFARLRELSEEERAKARERMEAISQEVEKKYRAKLAEILLPPQMQRLKQIVWQVDVPAALQDAEVVEALALSDQQKQTIASIVEEYQQKIDELMPQFPGRGGPGGPGRPGGRGGRGRRPNQDNAQDTQARAFGPGNAYLVLVQAQGQGNQQPDGQDRQRFGEQMRRMREQIQQLQQERDAKLLEVLSAEQRGKWQSLIGEPVDVAAIREAGMRGFGGFGRGGFGGGRRRGDGQPDRPPQE